MFTKVNQKLIQSYLQIQENLGAKLKSETGATTAEYAITVLAACAFAALLFGILSSGEMRGIVLGIITRALNSAG